MVEVGRNQIVVYAVIAVVLLLVGANSLRSGSDDSGGSFPAGAKSSVGSGGADPGGFAATSAPDLLVVDVSGGVARPGVYELKQGSRVIDAIKRAGGLLRKAVPGAINRAAVLADGQQVVVPLASGGGAGAGGGGSVSAAAGSRTHRSASVPRRRSSSRRSKGSDRSPRPRSSSSGTRRVSGRLTTSTRSAGSDR